MVDLSTHTIKRIFERQVTELTQRTIGMPKEELFNFQFSGGWLR